MEQFEITTIRLIEGNQFIIHNYQFENKTLVDINLSEVLTKWKSLKSGDILLINSSIDLERPDYMIQVSGERRWWIPFNNELKSLLSKDYSKNYFLPLKKRKDFWGRERMYLDGIAVSTHSISEEYSFLAHKTNCVIVNHIVS